jgi:ubiquitin C-terminal hydrolase
LATESFLENEESVRIDNETQTVHLSMLFKWYQSDFGQDKEDVLKWIFDHLPEDNEKKTSLGELLQNSDAEINVKYITYDWGHNEKK